MSSSSSDVPHGAADHEGFTRAMDSSMVIAGAGAGAGGAGKSKSNSGLKELQRVHRLLRGRYLWAISLGVILGVAGGLAGFRGGSQTYRSSGIIQIVPVVPQVLPKDQNGQM